MTDTCTDRSRSAQISEFLVSKDLWWTRSKTTSTTLISSLAVFTPRTRVPRINPLYLWLTHLSVLPHNPGLFTIPLLFWPPYYLSPTPHWNLCCQFLPELLLHRKFPVSRFPDVLIVNLLPRIPESNISWLSSTYTHLKLVLCLSDSVLRLLLWLPV